MEERLLLKITVTNETEEGCNVHSECPVDKLDDGLILTEIFERLMKRNPFFASAIETAFMVIRREKMMEKAENTIKDILAEKGIGVNPSKTQS